MNVRINNIFSEVEKITGEEFSSELRGELFLYINALLEKNKVVNLISRKSEDSVIISGIVETMALAVLLPDEINVLDVGSGGGIPGVLISIFKDLNITLMDSINKKILFLEEVAEILPKKNIKVVRNRLEDINQQYDVIISRGVGSFERLYPFYLRNIDDMGSIYFLTGIDNSQKEIFSYADIFPNPYLENRVIICQQKI